MIVVTTPTGQIGAQVLEHVLDGAAPVRVVVRDPARLPDAVRDRADVVPGSHDDPDVLARALDGAQSVFWLVPPNPRARATGHYRSFTRALTENLASHEARVVAVSSLGRGYPGPAGLLTPAWESDDRIESTGAAYRSLQLPYFMENLLAQSATIAQQGTLTVANAPDRLLAAVATRDAARAAADLLLDGSWTGQAGVPVVGDTLTPTQMAQILSEVLGHDVRLAATTPGQLRSGLVQRGADPGWAQDLAEMVTAQNDGVYDVGTVGTTVEVTLEKTTFRRWCETVLEPAVRAREG